MNATYLFNPANATFLICRAMAPLVVFLSFIHPCIADESAKQASKLASLRAKAKEHRSRGEPKGARTCLQDACALCRNLAGKNAKDLAAQRELATALQELADVTLACGQYKQCCLMLEEAAKIREQVAKDNPGVASDQRALADVLEDFSDTLQHGLQNAAQLRLELARRALELRSRLARDNPKNVEDRVLLACAQASLADALDGKDDGEAACEYYRLSLKELQKCLADDPKSERLCRLCAGAESDLATALLDCRKVDDALQLARHAVAEAETLLKKEPVSSSHQACLLFRLAALAEIHFEREEWELSLQICKRSLELNEGLRHEEPYGALLEHDRFQAMITLGQVQLQRGQVKAAVKWFERAHDTFRKVTVEFAGDLFPPGYLWQHDLDIASRLLAAGETKLAQQWNRLAREVLEETKPNGIETKGNTVLLLPDLLENRDAQNAFVQHAMRLAKIEKQSRLCSSVEKALADPASLKDDSSLRLEALQLACEVWLKRNEYAKAVKVAEELARKENTAFEAALCFARCVKKYRKHPDCEKLAARAVELLRVAIPLAPPALLNASEFDVLRDRADFKALRPTMPNAPE